MVLPEKLFGQDVDHLFAYATPKIVKIKDRHLGLLKIILMIAIFIYIVIFNIFVKGGHCKRYPVEGSIRLQWQEPSKCNPMKTDCMASYSSVKDLPYCSQYTGNATSKHTVQEQCAFFDAKELPMQLPSGVLIPTYVKEYKQKLGCNIHGDADGKCAKKYQFLDASGAVQSQGGDALPVASHYVADADDFTVLVDHTVVAGLDAVDDFNMKGYFEDCHKVKDAFENGIEKGDCVRRPIAATGSANLKVKGSLAQLGTRKGLRRGQKGLLSVDEELLTEADEDEEAGLAMAFSAEKADANRDPTIAEPKVFAIKFGDVISLQSILSMAARSLSEEWQGKEGPQTVRGEGAVVAINIEYNNWTPWTWSGMRYPEYTISARSRNVRKFKDYQVQENSDGTRNVKGNYGVLIRVQQTGELGRPNAVTLLIMLTTSLGLLAVSATLTDCLATMVMPRKAEYTALKFEESKDFSDHPPPDADKDGKSS